MRDDMQDNMRDDTKIGLRDDMMDDKNLNTFSTNSKHSITKFLSHIIFCRFTNQMGHSRERSV